MRFLRPLMCLAIVCSAGGSADAAFRTYDFTGTITSTFVEGATAPWAVGETYSGTLTFNPDATASELGPYYANHFGADLGLRLTVTVGGVEYSPADVPGDKFTSIHLANDVNYSGGKKYDLLEAFSDSSRTDGDVFSQTYLVFDLIDLGTSPSAITGLDLKGVDLSLSRFANGGLGTPLRFGDYKYDTVTGESLGGKYFYGTLDTLTLRSEALATPAPAGMVLGGIGIMTLLGYGGVRRRKVAAA